MTQTQYHTATSRHNTRGHQAAGARNLEMQLLRINLRRVAQGLPVLTQLAPGLRSGEAN